MSVCDLEAVNYDEIFMQQSLIFSDSLKDLKNLRKQLYSAAEYFEDSYTKGGEKQLVIETLKDYTVRALVNTVDHLGSVTTKVNELVDSKIEEVSESEIIVSTIEQRLRTCQIYSGQQGVSQQALAIKTPKYHKRYILPDGQAAYGVNSTVSSTENHSLVEKEDHFLSRLPSRNANRGTLASPLFSMIGKETPSQQPKIFTRSKTLQRNGSEKRPPSPQRLPLSRSGSLYSRPTTPNPVRPSPSNALVDLKRFPSEPRTSVSMNLRKDSVNHSVKDLENQPSKSKKIFMSLLTRRKSKKIESLNMLLDEY